MLDDAGERNDGVGVVDHGVPLVVVGLKLLGLEPKAPILQAAKPMSVEGINRAGEDDTVGRPICVNVEEVYAQGDA